MSRLVRLYPASWRARYGDELEALIADMNGTAAGCRGGCARTSRAARGVSGCAPRARR
jgi:hypothetical protein